MLDTWHTEIDPASLCMTHVLLPTRDLEWTVSRPREVWSSVIIPSELLGANGPGAPAISWIPHTVVGDPVLLAIWARRETSMPNTIG